MIAGDDVVVTKSGKNTYGLGRFFSSLYSSTVPSICFLSLSLISVEHRRSYPLMMEQVIKEKQPVENTIENTSRKGKKGRPSVRCNKNRQKVELSPYLQLVQKTLKALLKLVNADLN